MNNGWDLPDGIEWLTGMVWEVIAGDPPIAWEQQAALFASMQGRRAGYLRELLGNPFRPATLQPAWRNFAVRTLAQAVYDDRRFDDLPVLADALEETGCTDPDLLSHLRGPGPHVRGCWALDLVLGKE
jgi:hypothetical protein